MARDHDGPRPRRAAGYPGNGSLPDASPHPAPTPRNTRSQAYIPNDNLKFAMSTHSEVPNPAQTGGAQYTPYRARDPSCRRCARSSSGATIGCRPPFWNITYLSISRLCAKYRNNSAFSFAPPGSARLRCSPEQQQTNACYATIQYGRGPI
ncbi:hypothetical protein CALVIDRAFT_194121 [Calocera viscosa TUFC12733]|uniref:Uncharacterized protein n=1 Tax=Calocera viscosa (strain TUFC12733) TaxID=1330018 RepID=A0A167KRL3_CALVF|nr:hypothetical protein CALVIDRAFT_194121 [Calocera viscosa TUFC12733]